MKHIVTALTILLMGSGLVQAQTESTTPPVHTNKSRFRIPYRYDAAEMERLRAKEIRLYLSVDRGRNWQFAQAVAPDAKKFEFNASRDGEYWFSVRTLDGDNQLHPGGDTITPGLKVVVDTVEPILKINLRQTTPGKVELSWSGIDAFLDVDSLSLEFVQPGQQNWQKVRILPAADGQTSWSVPAGGIVAVRGTIKDHAGNEATGQMQASVDPSNAAVPEPVRPDFRKPIAESPSDGEMAQSFPGETNQTLNNSSRVQDPLASANSNFDRPVADQWESRPDALKGRYTPETQTTKPSGNVRIVGSTNFSLGYQLQDVGPSGISRVELYITQDDGVRWYRYGEDDDRTSPFEVKVPIEGVYGFAIRVKSGAGLALAPPENGDKPEVSVIVDQSPPDLKLLGVQPASGPQGAQVIIRWKITEEFPSPAPVSVSYAVNPDGPWVPITGWQADEGELAWRVSPQIPPHIFLKVEARDASGNQTAVITEKAVAVDLSRPSARIVDVEADKGNEFQK